MRPAPRRVLRGFYDQALLCPELLCLSCAHTAWNRAGRDCSPERRQDCILFVSDMVNRLAAEGPGPQLNRRPAPPPRP
jgi:hypothetical protein